VICPPIQSALCKSHRSLHLIYSHCLLVYHPVSPFIFICEMPPTYPIFEYSSLSSFPLSFPPFLLHHDLLLVHNCWAGNQTDLVSFPRPYRSQCKVLISCPREMTRQYASKKQLCFLFFNSKMDGARPGEARGEGRGGEGRGPLSDLGRMAGFPSLEDIGWTRLRSGSSFHCTRAGEQTSARNQACKRASRKPGIRV